MQNSSSSTNPWFASTIGLLGLIVGYAIASTVHGSLPFQMPTGGAQASAAAASSAAPSYTPPTVGDDSPMMGKSDAPITVIEFTDFQCPFCQRHFQQTFGQIKQNYVDTGKVKYVIRYFPLTQIHPNAEKSAEAAACANDQGKFWQMHEKLFTEQGAWSPLDGVAAATVFKKYAADLGLDSNAFSKCLDSGEKADKVKKDTADGSSAGINGTPGFWILGPNNKTQQVSGAYPYATFQTAFDGMVK